MPSPAIKFENISKQYRLGNVGTGTLSHDLNRWWAMNIRGKEDPYLKIGSVNNRETKADSDYVWALRDINFEVQQGEVLGIIGKNGAGKSTLLKILSRVTSPTTGEIKARGRIASLLEVGTGFHPEMTGRENIFMNGAIMGMTKAEIRRKMDEIIDFSGCERYIDTPVKRYSSGMTVRLGFAVAAHLEPEILVVDEVLAVGDAEFQKKAIGKMQDISKGEGRTVLFVSHNMTAIKQLCAKTILLSKGEIKSIDLTSAIINQYLEEGMEIQTEGNIEKITNKEIYFQNISITNTDGLSKTVFTYDDDISVNIFIKSNIEFDGLGVGLRFTNSEGIAIFSTCNYDKTKDLLKITPGSWHFHVIVPFNILVPGKYYLDIGLYKPGVIVFDHIDNEVILTIDEVNYIGNIMKDDRKGLIAPIYAWDIKKL